MSRRPQRRPAPRLNRKDVFPDPRFRLEIMRQPQHVASGGQHSHQFHELVLILGGRAQHEVGREVYPIEAGDVFVILGDTTHGYAQTESLSLINILFDPRHMDLPAADLGSLPGYHALFTVEPGYRAQGWFHNRLRLGVGELARATQLVGEIEEELRARRPGYRFVATAHLMRLMAYLSRGHGRADEAPSHAVAQLSEVLGYLERHYAEPLSVRDLTGVAHMSQTSLMRAFRRVLGRPPVDYLIRLRIGKAQALLRRTDLSVKEIAAETGFGDSNYFARQFRRIAGMSPSAFRTRT